MLREQVKKVFERARIIRYAVGIQMTVLSLLTILVYPTRAFDYDKSPATYLDGGKELVLTTKSSYIYPISSPTGVSQNYNPLHRGIDIRAPLGTPILAIDHGTVVEVHEQVFGYGKYVRVAHAGTLSSLYAHMSKIEVKPGQRVKAGEKLGEVGSTGWSTGSHLHIEVMEGVKTINPMLYVSDNQKTPNTRLSENL